VKSTITASPSAHRVPSEYFLASIDGGGIGQESVEGPHRTSDSTVNNAVYVAGILSGKRRRTAESMGTETVVVRTWCG
jgi:hypothetical protein